MMHQNNEVHIISFLRATNRTVRRQRLVIRTLALMIIDSDEGHSHTGWSAPN